MPKAIEQQFLDWKNLSSNYQERKNLETNWQTRLYLYVLAETSEYEPEQIQMTYWFVKSATPQSKTFEYSRAKHRQTERELTGLLADLKTWLQNYREFQINFSPITQTAKKTCPFYHGFAEIDPRQAILGSIDEIEEVSL